MKLFKIEKGRSIFNCKVSQQLVGNTNRLEIRIIERAKLKEDKIFEIEEIFIDPIKNIENKNYNDKVEYCLNLMGLSDIDYKKELGCFIEQGYYGFVTDIKNRKIIVVQYNNVDVV